MRLHAYSTRQRFLVKGNPGAIMNANLSLSRRQLIARWKRFDALQKTYLAIVLAFIIQVRDHSILMDTFILHHLSFVSCRSPRLISLCRSL